MGFRDGGDSSAGAFVRMLNTLDTKVVGFKNLPRTPDPPPIDPMLQKPHGKVPYNRGYDDTAGEFP